MYYEDIDSIYESLEARNTQKDKRDTYKKKGSFLNEFQVAQFGTLNEFDYDEDSIYLAVSEKLIIATVFSAKFKKWVFRCVDTYRSESDTRLSDFNIREVFSFPTEAPVLDCIGYHFFHGMKAVCIGIEHTFWNQNGGICREMCLVALRYSKATHQLTAIGMTQMILPDCWASTLAPFSARHRVSVTETQLKFTQKRGRIYSLYRPWVKQAGVLLIHCLHRNKFQPISSRGFGEQCPPGLIMFNSESFLIDSFVATRQKTTSVYMAEFSGFNHHSKLTEYKVHRIDLHL